VHIQIKTIEHTLVSSNFTYTNFNQYSYCVYVARCCVLYTHVLNSQMILHSRVLYIFPLLFGFTLTMAKRGLHHVGDDDDGGDDDDDDNDDGDKQSDDKCILLDLC